MRPSSIVCLLFVLHTPMAGAESVPATLTRDDAVVRALAASPEVRAAARDVRAQEALARQAGARPNPELRAEVENVGGSGSRQGFEETESTLRLVQRLELGGKRGARVRVAEGERGLAGWDYETARLAVAATTTKAFVATLAAQERLALTIAMERLARDTLGALERSVAAGGAAPADAARARVALGRTEIERAKAERGLATARVLLAATWGDHEARFTRVAGDLGTRGPLPSQPELIAALERSPALARWQTEQDARAAAMALERARGIPDVSVGAGGRHFSDNGDDALVFEVSVPLPVFDRNGGAVAAARERLAQARDEADAARLAARTALAEAYLRLADAHATATALESRLLPEARRAVEGMLDAFRKGALRPLDVLDARRVLFELEGEHLDALERFHLAAADLARLTAAPLAPPTEGGTR